MIILYGGLLADSRLSCKSRKEAPNRRRRFVTMEEFFEGRPNRVPGPIPWLLLELVRQVLHSQKAPLCVIFVGARTGK